MRRWCRWTISSQAAASPPTQRRTNNPTTWASSKPLLRGSVVYLDRTGTLRTQLHGPRQHSVDTSLWDTEFHRAVEQAIVTDGGGKCQKQRLALTFRKRVCGRNTKIFLSSV